LTERRRLLKAEAWIPSHMTFVADRIASFSPILFGFPRIMIIPAFRHTRLSQPPELCHSSDQGAGHYHNFGVEARGFISGLVFGWLQIKEVAIYVTVSCFFHNTRSLLLQFCSFSYKVQAKKINCRVTEYSGYIIFNELYLKKTLSISVSS
jgi:hypothetical protein